MITFLEGVVVEKEPTVLVLNVGGVGYELLIPLSTFDRVPGPGSTCRLLTYDHVREDQHALFGFVTREEKDLFLMLMEVTGIGPKTALGALSGMSARDLKIAIAGGDTKRLSSISGIGKKTAERMVLELRERVGKAAALQGLGGEAPSAGDVKTRDAILALIALGHKQNEALKMVRSAVKGDVGAMTVEEIIRSALSGGE